jgi:Raf kinase inhibitor-like YbhB/YbcL family protein
MNFKTNLLKLGTVICLTTFLLGLQNQSVAADSRQAKKTEKNIKEAAQMEISSPAFTQGKPIPSKYTCDGENISPALKWAGIPAKAKSLALVCDDPDAPRGNWVHWIIVNIPVSVIGIPENGTLPSGACEIINNFGQTKYGGPCPPSGTHRYFFKLYALDTDELKGATSANFRDLITRHTLVQVELMGTYKRQ